MAITRSQHDVRDSIRERASVTRSKGTITFEYAHGHPFMIATELLFSSPCAVIPDDRIQGIYEPDKSLEITITEVGTTSRVRLADDAVQRLAQALMLYLHTR